MKKELIIFFIAMLLIGTSVIGIESDKKDQMLINYHLAEKMASMLPGEDCNDPIIVDIPEDLDYSHDNTFGTCSFQNDYFDTCLGLYDEGEDVIYRLSVAEDTWVNITLDPYVFEHSGILIDDECPDLDGKCISYSTNDAASPHGFDQILLKKGEYFIMIDCAIDPWCLERYKLTIEGLREFGDAPEGNAIAYPSSGTTGSFPTCKTCGIDGWIEHSNYGAWFGNNSIKFDLEKEGNAGDCPDTFPPYDLDECFDDNDSGLLFPEPFTIDMMSGKLIPCNNCVGSALGETGETAVWGKNIDILVHNDNQHYNLAYVNVLMDWNQDGDWKDPDEYVLVDFPIPNPYSGPLSDLSPPPPSFIIKSNAGYIWARFTITERPIENPGWFGEGVFEDGETEDYLLLVEEWIGKEIVVANYDDNDITILKGNYDEINDSVSFKPWTELQLNGKWACDVFIEDFDNDGRYDIASTYYDDDNYPDKNGSLQIFYGDGFCNFPYSNNIHLGFKPHDIDVGDFNHDGLYDFAISNYGPYNENNNGPGCISIILSNKNTPRQYTVKNPIYLGRGVCGITTALMNDDEHEDIIVTNYGDRKINILYGTGTGDFQNVKGVDVGNAPEGISTGLFNNDNYEDIIVTNFDDDTVTILLSKDEWGDTFESHTMKVGANPHSIVVHNFNGDQYDDFAVTSYGNYWGDSINIFWGLGDGYFEEGLHIPVGLDNFDNNPYRLATEDFNDDGWPDIATTCHNLNCVDVLINDIANSNNFINIGHHYPVGGGPWGIKCYELNYYENEPKITIKEINGGIGISAVLENCGQVDAKNIPWSIEIVNGTIFLGKKTNGIIDIPAGEQVTINSDFILGFGQIDIVVIAGTETARISKKLLLFFIL